MSPDETKRLLAVASNLKARVMLSLSYGCGLRAGEVVRLKVKHIDSAQNYSDRAVEGPQGPQCHALPEMLALLRQWWKARPSRYDAQTLLQERWLFPAEKSRASQRPPAISTNYSMRRRTRRDQEGRDALHALRHSFATLARTRNRYQKDPGALGSR